MKILRKGNGDFSKAMIRKPGKIGQFLAICSDDMEVEAEDNSRTCECEALVKAAANGDAQMCKKLLDRGDVDVDGVFSSYTALQAASFFGHLDVMNILLKFHVNLESEDTNGDRALHYAAYSGEPLAITILARAKSDLNCRNEFRQTPLHIAVNEGYTEVVKELLKCGSYSTLQDCLGDTPLHDAIATGCHEIIELLIAHNSDILITNNKCYNAIHHAAYHGDSSVMRIMLDNLPETWIIDYEKSDGNTALHIAAEKNHIGVAETLIGFGADMNLKNINLETPLHLAIKMQNTQMIRLLVCNGCDINIQDKYGNIPFTNKCKKCHR